MIRLIGTILYRSLSRFRTNKQAPDSDYEFASAKCDRFLAKQLDATHALNLELDYLLTVPAN